MSELSEKFRKIVDDVFRADGFPESYSIPEICDRRGLAIMSGARAIGDEIFKLIAVTLKTGGKFGFKEFNQIKKQVIFEYFLNGLTYKPYLEIIDKIADATRQQYGQLANLDDSEAWEKVILMAVDHNRLTDSTHQYQDDMLQNFSYRREHQVCLKAKSMISSGYKVEVRNGNIFIEEAELEKISKKIDDLAAAVGGITLAKEILKFGKKYWDQHLQRFHFVRRRSQLGDGVEPNFPWGYLLNLAVKYPHQSAETSVQKTNLKQLFDMAVAISACQNVQPYSVFEGMYNSTDSVIRYIQEIVVYDSIFSVRQISPDLALALCSRLFDWVDATRFKGVAGWSIEQALVLFGNIFNAADTFETTRFSRTQLIALAPNILATELDAILDAFSHHGAANAKFISPLNYTNVDFQFKPLIKTDDYYWMLNPSMCAVGVFEAIASSLRTAGIHDEVDSRIGKAIEAAIWANFRDRKIPVSCGTYPVGKNEIRECDLVIETAKSVIFLEFKKKALTRSARAGSDVNLLVDLSSSLIDSQFQLGEHEYFLRKNGAMTLTNGGEVSTINLNGREIDKVSVALDEYGGLQDRSVLQQILSLFAPASFRAVDSKNQVKLTELSDKCRAILEQFQRFGALGTSVRPELYFFNSWFMSLPQLICILNEAVDNDSFQSSLWKTRHISAGSLDLYFERHQADLLKSKN